MNDMNISYSTYYKPVTLLFFMFLCISISMFICLLTAAFTTRPYTIEYHTFIQPDGTPVELRVFGDDFSIQAVTPEGSIVVRDTRTDWICFAVINNQDFIEFGSEKGLLVSSGIPYIPGNVFSQGNAAGVPWGFIKQRDTFLPYGFRD